ncbi:site-2 protease family protein [Candidatus Giovannonibacteria bacterium]|nr:site-2 protease family protein [Candidatus Giovannonibacteria bacterium]
MEQVFNFAFQILILIFSIVIHEVSHGFAALYLGDPTAKYEGRLTLNPLKHVDLFGSIILPIMAFLTAGFIFGWAKPVPYNPYNLKNQKWGPAFVGAAGPVSNILVALFFGMLIRFSAAIPFLPAAFFQVAIFIAFLNLVLAVFNLVPIPPLDGSKVLFALLPPGAYEFKMFLERYGFFLLLIFIFFLSNITLPIVSVLFRLITGVNF